MATTNLSDISSLTAQIYNDSVFVWRETNLMRNLVTATGAQGYMPRNIPKWNSTVARDVADGEDFVTNDVFSKSALATLTPKEVQAQLILTDQMMLSDADGAMNAASVELGLAVAQKMDKDLVGLFSTFSDGKGTANNALTLALCAAALAVVHNNGGRGQTYGVLHPLTDSGLAA